MQCTGNSGCFLRGKRAATVRRYPAFSLSLYAVFSCFYTTGFVAYSFTTDRYGIFNVRTNLSVCRTYKSAQEMTGERGDRTTVLTCPTRGSNPGSSDLNFD